MPHVFGHGEAVEDHVVAFTQPLPSYDAVGRFSVEDYGPVGYQAAFRRIQTIGISPGDITLNVGAGWIAVLPLLAAEFLHHCLGIPDDAQGGIGILSRNLPEL